MRRTLIGMCAAGACALLAAGCGGSGGGLASKSPKQILDAGAAALRAVGSYRLVGYQGTGRDAEQISFAAIGDTRFDVTLTTSAAHAELRFVRGTTYLRANVAYFETDGGGAVAAAYANRWIRLPAGNDSAGDFAQYAPKNAARCLTENLGTLTKAGTTRIGGRAAIVLRDAGDRAGSRPGTLAVATTGTPYPLRITVHGSRRSGGTHDICDPRGGSDQPGSLTLSSFDQVPAINPPTGALSIK